MGRNVAAGAADVRPGGDRLRASPDLRLPLPRGAVRELDAAPLDHLLAWRRDLRRGWLAGTFRTGEQSLRPGGDRAVDRPRLAERHPDPRVSPRTVAGRQVDRPRRPG